MRVTRKELDENLFPTLVKVAAKAGIDTSNWSFGRHYGNNYSLARRSDTGYHKIEEWPTLSTAHNGMSLMIRAYMLVNNAREEVNA